MTFDRPQEIYRIDQIDTEWGSYSSIMVSGFFGHPNGRADDVETEDDAESNFEILRTGPFVPPITFPGGDCVIDEVTMMALKQTDFHGYHLTPVKIGKMVNRDWQNWDRTREFDFSNYADVEIYCPEDLVLKPKGDESLLSSVGRYWKLDAEVVDFGWAENFDGKERISWSLSSINDNDFSCPSFGLVYVTKRVKTWIDNWCSGWVKYETVVVED